jgi:hypothetical protein
VHVLQMRGMGRRPDRPYQELRGADDNSEADQLGDCELVAKETANLFQHARLPLATAPGDPQDVVIGDNLARQRPKSVSSINYVNGHSDSAVGFLEADPHARVWR